MIIAVGSYAQSFFLFSFWATFGWLARITVLIAVVWYLIAHIQYASGLPDYSFWQTLHFTAPKMKFYDLHLDNAVWYARHAMSIDENRADFARVPASITTALPAPTASRKACPVTRELAFKIVNVSADFGALGPQGCDDMRFGHCLFALPD